jgi:uncharacterized membrane protein YgcG
MAQGNTTGNTTTEELGLTGLIFNTTGTVAEEFLPALQGRNAIRVYKEMRENDPVVGAIVFAIDMLLRSVDWQVEANPDSPTSVADAEFLEQCKDDMSHTWADFVSEVMTMIVYGWSYFEIVYKIRNGPQDDNDPNAPAGSNYNDKKLGWRKFAIRSQESLERWAFDTTGGVQGLIQRPAPEYNEILIPIQKSLLFRTNTLKNNPEGRSLLRSAYRPWFFKQRIENIEGTGIERDLAGLPIAYVDPAIMRPDADPSSKAILASITRIVQNIKRDKQEGLVWPMLYDEQGHQLYDLKLLSAGGARQFDTSGIITRYNQAISMTVLADFIMLGQTSVGSFALSSDKTDLFGVALGTFLNSIADVVNQFAVKRLFTMNGLNTEQPPKIKHGDISSPDLQEVAGYILSLVQAGMPMFPDTELENHLRQIAHLPEAQELDDADVPELPEPNDDVVSTDDPAQPKEGLPGPPPTTGGSSGSSSGSSSSGNSGGGSSSGSGPSGA